jgi:hypothetical protein
MEVKKHQELYVYPEHFEVLGSPKSHVGTTGNKRKITRDVYHVAQTEGGECGRCYKWDSLSKIVTFFEVARKRSENMWTITKVLHQEHSAGKPKRIPTVERLKSY